MANLLSTPALVESPFIIAKIGDYTFGAYKGSKKSNRFGSALNVNFPNFMDSLRIVKLNGTVNTYTLKMTYNITETSDPNLLEKVFGSVSNTRKITLSYGDWNSPSFIYKEEVALITDVKTNVDFSGSKIQYTISAVSEALNLAANVRDYPARNAKPSDVIRELLMDQGSGLMNIFYGMHNITEVMNLGLLAGDDQVVQIDAQQSMSVLNYLNYLVSCMICNSDSATSTIKSYRYFLTIVDDTKGTLPGPYFSIRKVAVNAPAQLSFDTYELDVGYPGNNFVSNFTINNEDSWSILYNYSTQLDTSEYLYKIDNEGKLVSEYSPQISRSALLLKPTSSDQTWWTNVTQFPISATVTLRGLVRPTMLMSYVKINAYFYGKKHISSGLYIINKQEDSISQAGYKTTLSLIRLKGDTL